MPEAIVSLGLVTSDKRQCGHALREAASQGLPGMVSGWPAVHLFPAEQRGPAFLLSPHELVLMVSCPRWVLRTIVERAGWV